MKHDDIYKKNSNTLNETNFLNKEIKKLNSQPNYVDNNENDIEKNDLCLNKYKIDYDSSLRYFFNNFLKLL